jgi:sporulation protein YlmC with PRC-barrel domain
MKLEDLRPGASVISADGHKLGTLSRFVVRKDDFTLTHIVVDTGIIRSGEPLWKLGWGLSHDRVVPLGVLESADTDEIRITMSADEFRDLSVDYIDEQFAPIADASPGRFDASDLRRLAASIPGEPGPYFMYEKMAIAPDEADIKKNSPVWRMRPHEKIGEVDGVIFDKETSKVVDLVIRRGHFFSKDVVLPIKYVTEVVAGIVRVEIGDDPLKRLSEHHAAD